MSQQIEEFCEQPTMQTFLKIEEPHRKLLVSVSQRVLKTEKGNVEIARKVYNLSRSSQLTETQRNGLIALVRASRFVMETGMTNEISVYSQNRKILLISFGKEFPNQFFVIENTKTQVKKELSLYFDDYKDYLLDFFVMNPNLTIDEIWINFEEKRKPFFKNNEVVW